MIYRTRKLGVHLLRTLLLSTHPVPGPDRACPNGSRNAVPKLKNYSSSFRRRDQVSIHDIVNIVLHLPCFQGVEMKIALHKR